MPKNEPIVGPWEGIQNLTSIAYTCGWCGNLVASEKGWHRKNTQTNVQPLVQICSFCNKPTLWDEDLQRYPSPRQGGDVRHLPPNVQALYDEARDCISVNANTAVVLVCRTIISHIATLKGAKRGDTFNHHINYLRENNHFPVGAEVWVDVIREKGGDAAHDLEVIDKATAETVLDFLQMLLVVTIQYPEQARISKEKREVESQPQPEASDPSK